MKKLLIVLMMGIMLLTMVSAEQSNLGTMKQGTCFDLYQICDDCSYVNLTAIKYPNGLIETFNLPMTKNGQNFNYTFCNTSEIGDYTYTVGGNKGGIYSTEVIAFETTYTGKESPEGIIQIVFIIGFLIIIFFLGSLFISNLGHFAQGDYDLGELIKNVSLYFVVLAFYFLHGEYLALPLIDTILVWLIGIGGFTHVAMSFLAFLICHMKRVMEHKTNVREYGE